MTTERIKRPAFQFYPGDWRSHAALHTCSVGARGLWIEMMCVMHQGEPYGHLVLNGKAIESVQLARMVGSTDRQVTKWLVELEGAGVFARGDGGRMYSPRMVRDEQARNNRAAGGKLGAEHGVKGAEHGAKGGRPRKETGDIKPPLEPAPSVSSSSSPSDKGLEAKSTVGRQAPDDVGGENICHDLEKPRQLRAQAVEILEFLNEKAGKNYQPVRTNINLIVARLREGGTVDDMRAIVAKKCREWRGREGKDEYLRPATLFGAENFWQKYQGELAPAGTA